MDTLTVNPVKSMIEKIQKALDQGMSYQDYRLLVSNLAEQNSNSGPEITEALTNYTQLNDKRMRRWDKTLRIREDITNQVNSIEPQITWLVLTESWCGDASPSLPVMNKLAESNPKLDLVIALRDEHPELMDHFLTKGARSIPKLIALKTKNLEVLGEWGPRSTKATKMVEDFKSKNGTLTAEFKKDLQVFYNQDKGMDILKDLLELLTLE